MAAADRLAAVQSHVSAPDALLGFAPTRATAEPPQLPDCFRNTSNFKYTRDQQCAEFPDALTPEERQFYEDNGYLIKRGIVPEWLRNKMNGHFTDLVQGKAALGGMTLIRDLGMLRKVKQGLLPQEYKTSELGVYKVQGRFSDTFMEWVRFPPLVKVARCMAGPDVKSQHHMYINKGPDHDRTSIHALHQDSAYFPWTGQDFVVACWTALVDVTRENGCLVVLPGSHKDGLREHGVPDYMETNAGFHTCTDYIWRGTEEYAEVRATGERRPLVFAEMKAGDTIFFHPMVVHGSGFNLTKDTCRKSLTVHYGSARSRYFAQDQFVGTPQDYIANEIMTSIQRVKKEDVRPDVARESHLNTWKATSRQVCGHDYRNELKIDDYL